MRIDFIAGTQLFTAFALAAVSIPLVVDSHNRSVVYWVTIAAFLTAVILSCSYICTR